MYERLTLVIAAISSEPQIFKYDISDPFTPILNEMKILEMTPLKMKSYIYHVFPDPNSSSGVRST